jgi:DNA replication and repair protein RecF
LRIETLYLHNFRNYSQLQLSFDDRLNLFIGANAQGKTNLLEAMTFLATGKSHRTRNEEEMILWGADSCSVAAKVGYIYGESALKIDYYATQRKKTFNVNGLTQKKSAFSGKLTTVIFTPEDLAIVKGSPSNRRKFLDDEISKVSAIYEDDLNRYQHVIRQRNYLLKTHRKKILASEELASWNEQLAPLAAKIVSRRISVIYRLGLLSRLAQRRLTGRTESLEINYISSFSAENTTGLTELKESFLKKLSEKKELEASLGQTLVGPHRDDFQILLNGREARLFASQGQQRTMVLSLKMAELEFIKGETGEFPVLLFDDVFSELDEQRRLALLEAIDGRVQTFITGTEADKIGKIKIAGQMFQVAHGEVK